MRGVSHTRPDGRRMMGIEGKLAEAGKPDICDALQQEIIFGQLRPRERLIEDELIARFDTTRHAVRNAFVRLDQLGLVVRHPNRGVQVRDYSEQEVEELYEIREVLESRAAARMPLPASPALITELSRIASEHREVSRTNEFSELFRLNNEFHETFFAAAGNLQLAEAIRHYAVATHPIRNRAFRDSDHRRAAADEHHAIVEAMEQGDRKQLVKLCVDHIRRPKAFWLQANRF